jgi:short subunit dehydrogenase-like uncharacterized protein
MAHTIVLHGATSFVGQIVTRHLFQRHGAGRELRWAIAGRSVDKLKAVRAGLGAGAENLPLIVADADDDAALKALCADTQVVASTVGPYALYGSKLVRACAEAGTDYCDLSGEVPWIARMIAAHEDSARTTGARIVHSCGFDSVPSDLGTWFLQQRARERLGAPCARVKLRVRNARGGISGGTAASLMNVMREAGDPVVRHLMSDPYSITPGGSRGRPRQPEVRFVEYDHDARSWIAPFVMAAVNTRLVHRTNALAGDAYGTDFVYDEATLTGSGVKGCATAIAMGTAFGSLMLATALPPSRWLLEKFVVPKPGKGPSSEAQEKGGFDLRLFGIAKDGSVARAKVTGDRDPGYGSTAKMLGEAAACLALDVPKSALSGGFWTPATALGDRLLARLTANAGLTFEMLD